MCSDSVRRMLTLGGKGSSLSPASVFEFASRGELTVQIDASALTSSKAKAAAVDDKPFQVCFPDYLTPDEIRASLLVLLNKLLLGRGLGFPPSHRLQLQLLDALNNTSVTGIALPLALDDIDHGFASSCWPNSALHGILALLDCVASGLSTVADAVASLSCEALKADVASAFNLFTDSGDGSSSKDCVAVAADYKVLLNGSKLCGGDRRKFVQVSNIPKVHGRLRSISRSIHATARVELNSAPNTATGTPEDLTAVLSPLALAFVNLGKSSWDRAKLCLDNLFANDNTLFPDLPANFNLNCPTIEALDASLKSFFSAYFENDYIKSFHQVYSLCEIVRKILSWEATISVLSLEGSELISPSPPLGGENAVSSKKKDKGKKVMGKGTAVLMQFIKEGMQSQLTEADDGSVLLQNLSQHFLSLLDLKNPGFESLLQKVKDVVDSNESRRLPKLPKGTRDFAKEQMAIREKAFSIIGDVFKRHGAMALDTPVFEMKETLTGKYGEDSKLIYDLADQGGELCSLRYDLTVPFARYVAMNGLTSFRRYQIAKVYRRDNPSKGRYREFYQCDFDIAGDETVGPDFEVIRILTELLDELNIGAYEIKLNHRKLLDGMLDICGVPSDKIRSICSSIDKLDKQSFDQIKKEMVDEKGLNVETVDKIGSFVMRRGHPLELLSEFKREGSEFLKNDASNDALENLEKLFKALESAKCIEKVVFDLSLARGLDYYTGVIFEAVFKGTTQVGSIAAGGRYDNLINMFGGKPVPAVGVSLGIERVFTIMEQLQKDQNQAVRATETQVLISVLGDDISLAAELVSRCWDAKLKAEFMVNKRFAKHMQRAKDSRIPWMVIVGERELKEQIVKLKDISGMEEEIEVDVNKFVEELVARMSRAAHNS